MLSTSSIKNGLPSKQETCGFIFTTAFDQAILTEKDLLKTYVESKKLSAPTTFLLHETQTSAQLIYIDLIAETHEVITADKDKLKSIKRNFELDASEKIIEEIDETRLNKISTITGFIRKAAIYRSLFAEMQETVDRNLQKIYRDIGLAHPNDQTIVEAITKKIIDTLKENKADVIRIGDHVITRHAQKQISAGHFGQVKEVQIVEDDVFVNKAVIKKTGKVYLKPEKFFTIMDVQKYIEQLKEKYKTNLPISLMEAVFSAYLQYLNHPRLQQVLVPFFGGAIVKNKLGGLSVYQYFQKADGDLSNFVNALIMKPFSDKEYKELLEISQQLLNAIIILHDEKIFHRDLKLSNVLINRNEKIEIKLTDFGAAIRFVDDKKIEVSRWAAKSILPPEFIPVPPSNTQEVSLKQDAWETGLMLLHLWSIPGRYTEKLNQDFLETIDSLVENHHKNAAVKKLTQKYLSRCPDILQDIIVGLLDFNPNSRLTVKEAYQQLMAAQKNLHSFTFLKKEGDHNVRLPKLADQQTPNQILETFAVSKERLMSRHVNQDDQSSKDDSTDEYQEVVQSDELENSPNATGKDHFPTSSGSSDSESISTTKTSDGCINHVEEELKSVVPTNIIFIDKKPLLYAINSDSTTAEQILPPAVAAVSTATQKLTELGLFCDRKMKAEKALSSAIQSVSSATQRLAELGSLAPAIVDVLNVAKTLGESGLFDEKRTPEFVNPDLNQAVERANRRRVS